MILLPGLAGYVLFLLFDLNKIRWHCRLGNLLFPAGGVLLGLSVGLCILSSVKDGFTLTLWGAVSMFFALISLLTTVYALFFALPANTYSTSGELTVVATGLYGLCRHPACWPYACIFLFLYIAFGGKMLLWAMFLYPGCNLLYVWLQDRYIFPAYIKGYEQYRSEVPFLIPRFGRK